ncbi:MAG: DNA integrity scanning protein DisA nucleotide-binding domain protein [Candidatus Diapherotrites archaeon]
MTLHHFINEILGQGKKENQTPLNVEKTPSKRTRKIQKIQKICIDMAIDIVKAGEGGLFVIGETKNYSILFPNLFENTTTTIFDKGMDKVLVKLGQIDGAIVIDSGGKIKAYGAHLTRQIAHPGHGTRHAAAKGISVQPGVTAVLASQEDKMVRIFKGGVQMVEINPHTKGVETHLDKIVNFINKPEAALVTGAAVGSTVLGVALLPGIVVFAGGYLLASKIFGLAKDTRK